MEGRSFSVVPDISIYVSFLMLWYCPLSVLYTGREPLQVADHHRLVVLAWFLLVEILLKVVPLLVGFLRTVGSSQNGLPLSVDLAMLHLSVGFSASGSFVPLIGLFLKVGFPAASGLLSILDLFWRD